MQSASGSSGSALPPPEDLKKYDAASPGLGRKIIEMVQEEQRHLHSMDRAQVALSRRGQLFGFIIAISFLVVAGVLVGLGHSVAGTIIGSVDLVGLTTVFVVGQRSQRSALEAGGPSSTDRVIRELRRAQSKGRRSRKPQENPPQVQVEQAATDQTKPPPASMEESKGTAISSPPDMDESVKPESPQDAEGASEFRTDRADTSTEASKELPVLTDEDIQLYRRIYGDPSWRPDKSQGPAL